MDQLIYFADIFIHLDQHLVTLVNNYGTWTYFILFAIIFCETGLVVTPILPGDSLLFAVGALAGRGGLQLDVIIILLLIAAVLGDAVNYHIGAYIGPKVFEKNYRFLNRSHLDRTQRFYEKYGGKTIVIARFVPIVRTFAPFLAGVGKMGYSRFLTYNGVGAVLWIFSLVLGGYYFSDLPVVRDHFSLVIVAIIILSILPAVVEIVVARREGKRLEGTARVK